MNAAIRSASLSINSSLSQWCVNVHTLPRTACFGFGSSGANRGACTVGFFGKHVSNTVLAQVHRSAPDLKFMVSGRTTPTHFSLNRPADDVVDVDVGATEPINRLLRIPDDEERPWAKRHLPPVWRTRLFRLRRDVAILCQPEDDLGLHGIGVLELVDQQVPGTSAGVPVVRRCSHAARVHVRLSRSP